MQLFLGYNLHCVIGLKGNGIGGKFLLAPREDLVGKSISFGDNRTYFLKLIVRKFSLPSREDKLKLDGFGEEVVEVLGTKLHFGDGYTIRPDLVVQLHEGSVVGKIHPNLVSGVREHLTNVLDVALVRHEKFLRDAFGDFIREVTVEAKNHLSV